LLETELEVDDMATVRKRFWKAPNGEIKERWICDYFDQQGRRHQIAKPNKKAATQLLYKVQHEIERGVHTPASSSITIAEAGALWLAKAEADGLERSTLQMYSQHLRIHICPFIGTVKLAKFEVEDVDAFEDKLLAEGRSRPMVRGVRVTLGSLIGHAMRLRKVNRNVVRDASRKRRGADAARHEKRLEVGVDIPTPDEITALLNVTAPLRWRALIHLVVFTGLRASELRGLAWSAVDFNSAYLTVSQRADRWGVIGDPKSAAGRRKIPLAPEVVAILRQWKVACPPGELVFANGKGKPENLAIITYGLRPIQKAAGIAKPYGLHAFRHAAASLFIERFSPKRVQEMMGHSSIQVTFDVYGHWFPSPEDDQAKMRQLQARLLGHRNTNLE
jgi:integrase